MFPGFTFAFQPIVDATATRVYSYEALIRGANGESAYSVLKQLSREDLPVFDAQARLVALQLAAKLGLRAKLNLNCVPARLVVRAPSETIEAASDRPSDHAMLWRPWNRRHRRGRRVRS